MKRVISFFLACIMSLPLGALTAFEISATELQTAASEKTVYVNNNAGAETNSGADENNPVKTLGRAYELLGDNGGSVMIKGTYRIDAAFTAPAHSGEVVIKGNSPSLPIYLNANFALGGPTVFENFTVKANTSTVPSIICNYHDFSVKETVTMANPAIVINSQSDIACTPKDNTVTLNGGKWSEVVLGIKGRVKNQNALNTLAMYNDGCDTTLNVGGNAEIAKIFGTARLVESTFFKTNIGLPNSSVRINLLGGKVTTFICQSDSQKYIFSRLGGMTVYIGKDFDFAGSFGAKAASVDAQNYYSEGGIKLFAGISGEGVWKTPAAVFGDSKVIIASERYDALKDSALFRSDLSVYNEENLPPDLSVTGGVVYLSSDGDNKNTGDSPEAPVKTLWHAYSRLGSNGGEIVVTDEYKQDHAFFANNSTLGHKGKITVRGMGAESSLEIADMFSIGGPTELKDIKLKVPAVVCNFHDFTVADTVTTFPEGSKTALVNRQIFVSATPKSNSITLNGGRWGELTLGEKGTVFTSDGISQYDGVDLTLNIGGSAHIDGVYTVCHSANGKTSADFIPNSSAAVNLNGGQIDRFICESDNLDYLIAHGRGTVVNIGEGFDIYSSFNAADESAADMFCGISGGNLYTTAKHTDAGRSRVVLSMDKYEKLDPDALFRLIKVEPKAVMLAGYSATLGENVGINFFFKLHSSVISDPSAKIVFSSGKEIPVSTVTAEANGYFKFTCDVAAKEMTDIIKAQAVSTSGTSDVFSYTVAQYAEQLIERSGDSTTVSLAKALLNYGATAQIKFDHNTEDLANASLAATGENIEAEVKAETLAEHEKKVSPKISGIRYAGTTAVWNTYTHVRHYFDIEENANITFSIDDTAEETKYSSKNDLYYIEIPGIYPQNMSDRFTLTVKNGAGESRTVEYSVYAYFYDILRTSKDQHMIDAVEAAYAYGEAAKAYIAAHS